MDELLDTSRTTLRLQEGRNINPSIGIIIAKASRHALFLNKDKGYDGGKKIADRKRHIVEDTFGYPLAIDVHSATPHDSNCAETVLTGL